MAKSKLIMFVVISFFVFIPYVFAQHYIDINSNVMEMHEEKKLIIFTGDVVAKRQNMNLYCDKLNVYYVEGEDKKRDVERLEAEGNVKLIQLDKVATGNSAKYFKSEELIILEGNPAVLKEAGGNEVRGKKITFYVKQNKSVVEGDRPKVIFKIGD